ncbi:hypothetical protein GCM10020001_080710 [Nonomuraea salmonea]
MSVPLNHNRPALGRTNPASNHSNVDFPAPRRPQQRDRLPLIDDEIHVPQRDHLDVARLVDLHDPVTPDETHPRASP